VTSISAAVDLVDGHDALQPAELAARVRGREEFIVQQVFAARGQRLLADGRILYQQAQPDDAATTVETSVPLLTEAVEYTKDVRALWDAWLLLANIEVSRADNAAAEQAVRRAVVLQAARRPDPAVVPPMIVEMYERLAAEAIASAGTISLARVDEGTLVWVDGELREPKTMVSVPPGQHHVHVQTPNGQVGYMRVEVVSGQATEPKLEVAEPALGSPSDTSGGRSQQIASLYESLGRLSRVDVVLLAGRVEDELALQLYAPSVGAYSEVAYVEDAGDLGATVDDLLELLDGVLQEGGLDPDATTFVAAPLDISANPTLSSMLLAPETGAVTAPLLGQGTTSVPTTSPREPRDVSKKPKWPIYVGIGAGVAVAAGVATALGVAHGGGGGEGEGGTIVFGGKP
jgi:hypothetical protein